MIQALCAGLGLAASGGFGHPDVFSLPSDSKNRFSQMREIIKKYYPKGQGKEKHSFQGHRDCVCFY